MLLALEDPSVLRHLLPSEVMKPKEYDMLKDLGVDLDEDLIKVKLEVALEQWNEQYANLLKFKREHNRVDPKRWEDQVRSTNVAFSMVCLYFLY